MLYIRVHILERSKKKTSECCSPHRIQWLSNSDVIYSESPPRSSRLFSLRKKKKNDKKIWQKNCNSLTLKVGSLEVPLFLTIAHLSQMNFANWRFTLYIFFSSLFLICLMRPAQASEEASNQYVRVVTKPFWESKILMKCCLNPPAKV